MNGGESQKKRGQGRVEMKRQGNEEERERVEGSRGRERD